MTSRRYATLDRNRLGQALMLDEAGMQITTSEVCDLNRTVLGTLPAMSGSYGYELYFWSGLQKPFEELVSFGVANPDKALDSYVGSDTKSYGWVVGKGEIRSNNLALASVAIQGERIPFGLRLHLSPTDCSVEWLVNGTVVETTALPTGRAWLPAISIGSEEAGDIKAIINTGLDKFDALPGSTGWWQQTAGLSTFYLSINNEGFMSAPTDSPANTPFGPRIVNSRQIAIRREPTVWWHRGGGGTNPAAVTSILLDNSDGEFDALLRADAKDSAVVLQQVRAPKGGAGSLVDAVTVFTGVLERASAGNDQTVELVLRDTLSRFDVPLRMRKIPPFYDPSSAGRPVPLGLGSQRNVRPMLLSEPDRLYLLGDCPMTNVAQVSDMGAPLDPYALPPQYTPALDGAGIQLQTLPVGRLAADCSTVGSQIQLPGADDALAGIGRFETWPVADVTPTSTPPQHFTMTNYAGSVMRKFTHPPYAPTSVTLRLTSTKPWSPDILIGTPPAYSYGDVLATDNAPLLGGRAYRLIMRVPNVYAEEPAQGKMRGGLIVRTALSNKAEDAVTPHGIPISIAVDYRQDLVIDFRVPAGPNRELYFCAVPSAGEAAGTGKGSGGFEILDVRLQLLGQYEDAPPLDGIGIGDCYREVLVNRMGEDASVFNSFDALALDAGFGFKIGVRYEDTPNVLDVLTEVADQYGAMVFTDEQGQVRLRALHDGGAPVAKFTRANVNISSIRDYPDPAHELTTQWACRPNCTPFGDGDFVTDATTVTPSIREQYVGKSQFRVDANVQLAQQHSAAYGAGRRHTRLDDKRATQIATNFVASMYSSPRRMCAFDAYYDDETVGVELEIPAQKLYPCDTILMDIPEKGYEEKEMKLLAVSHYPADKRFELIGWYKA